MVLGVLSSSKRNVGDAGDAAEILEAVLYAFLDHLIGSESSGLGLRAMYAVVAFGFISFVSKIGSWCRGSTLRNTSLCSLIGRNVVGCEVCA